MKRKKPRLTEKNKKERLVFGRQHRPSHFCKSVFASDEKSILINTETRGEWVEKGEEASQRGTEKFEMSVKVWAGCGWEGKSKIYFIPKKMSGRDYLNFIKGELEEDILRLSHHPRQNITWLQDREGFHTAKIVQKYLEKSALTPISSWPSHSPDLNWQENVWEMLEQGVRKRRPINLDGLKKVVKDEWGKIPLDSIRKCIESMPRRCEAVIAANGGNTKY